MSSVEQTESRRRYDRDWHAANRDKCVQKCRTWRLNNPDKMRLAKRKSLLKHKYGLTIEQHAAILTSQGNCCAICKVADPGDPRGWHTDHCHETGSVRGLLCASCNLGLGKFKDSAEFLLAAAEYITNNKKRA